MTLAYRLRPPLTLVLTLVVFGTGGLAQYPPAAPPHPSPRAVNPLRGQDVRAPAPPLSQTAPAAHALPAPTHASDRSTALTPSAPQATLDATHAPAGEIIQATALDSDKNPDLLTVDSVTAFSQKIREAPGIADEAKTELLSRYESAAELLKSADEAKRRIAQCEKDIQLSSETIEAARSKLAQPPKDPSLELPLDKTISGIETTLQQAELQLKDARTRLAEREANLKNRAERRAELIKKIEDAKQRLAETTEDLALPAPPDDSEAMVTARRTELLVRQQTLPVKLKLFETELQRSSRLADLFPLERDLAKRETNQLEKQVSHYQALVAEAKKKESDRLAREARRRAEMADPALRDLAEYNASLADTRKRVSEKVTSVSAEVKATDQQLDQLDKDFEAARLKVEKAGHSTTVALLLRRQRDGLPDPAMAKQRLRFVEQEMPIVNLQRIELEEEWTTLGDAETAQELVIQGLDAKLSQAHGEYLAATVRELLNSQRDLLDKLIAELDSYLFALGELESRHRELTERSSKFREFIDEHVLWIRSTDPISLSIVSELRQGVIELADHQEWLRVAAVCGVDTLKEPWTAVGVLAAFGMLLAFQTRLLRRIRQLCENRSNTIGLKLSPSLHALLLTVVVSAAWPILIGYMGWRMSSSSHATPFGMAVGQGLMYAAAIVWMGGFVRSLCKRDGVAETFFAWHESGCKVGRQAVHWLTACAAPLATVVFVTHLYQQGAWADSIGRIAFILAMLLFAAFAYRVLGHRNNIFRASIEKDPKAWLSRIRPIANAGGIGIPIALAILAAVGYFYSAQQLAIRLQMTVFVAFVVALSHAVISRWFIVKRRRLAMEQARERRADGHEDVVDSGAGPITAPPVSDAPDWADVHGRLRLLLRHALTVAMVIAVWFIWSDVLPALKILDHVEMWSKTVEVTEQVDDGSGSIGSIKNVKNLKLERTTLRHGLTAAMILLGTFMLGRNLPALLEITMLNRLPLDRGGRHALSIILHYSIALTGALIAFRTLGINWSSVQWLVAGVTVGLGFGLQEIFANFVSGIILLFERPIRVGDIITLGDVTGTVTNIRMRATTVTNWDRKELIVPNKDLVTGRLLNWTLSDTTNRIVVNVGVAYKSDVNVARRIMEETVMHHPNVLKDPPPNVTFEAFGDSTLNFVIRAYIASLEVRLVTIHELNTSLHERLTKAGVEIAFPQRDINIRNVNWPAQALGNDRSSVGRRQDAA